MFMTINKYCIAMLLLVIMVPVSAHMSPEHALLNGLENTNIWSLKEILFIVTILVFFIIAISNYEKILKR